MNESETPALTLAGNIVVDEAQADQRVDVLVARVSGAARGHVANAAKAGTLLVNGKIVKGSTAVVHGDVVDFSLSPLVEFDVQPEAMELNIVFEDETLLVVNKPAGLVTHPAHGSPSGTLVNGLLAHVGALPGEAVRAGLVHRLDRDTSGLLIVAKTSEALSTLGKAMQKRYITREYFGIVLGTPDDEAGTLDGPLARDPQHRLRYAVRAEGKPAVTHFRVREKLKGATELSFRLETGRTHQIRVHLASYGFPILNDPLYGRRDRRLSLPGQALHAGHLAFRHPVTREELVFDVPPTADYEAAKDLFR
jgi:23S rRNA pseudouridine1911/1915/1917 synthase